MRRVREGEEMVVVLAAAVVVAKIRECSLLREGYAAKQ
jgi:hypothetical protein